MRRGQTYWEHGGNMEGNVGRETGNPSDQEHLSSPMLNLKNQVAAHLKNALFTPS